MVCFRNIAAGFMTIILVQLLGCSSSDPEDEPSNEELSKVEGISIVRVENPGFSGVSFNLERTELLSVKVEGETLSGILRNLDGKGHWFLGSENFPKGLYRFQINNLPLAADEAFEKCIEAYEKAFDLEISIENHGWEGYRVEMPQELPSFMSLASNEDKYFRRSGGPGYEFGKYTMKQLSGWLQSELKKPVDLDAGKHTG